MQATSTGSNHIWPYWWKFAGVDGIIWAVLFFIGIMIQGEGVSRSDPIDEIRAYFVEDGDTYLLADYLIAIGFVIFLLPYMVALRWFIGAAEGSPPIWSWMSFTGGVVGVALAGAAGAFWGALALNLAENPEVDDATISLVMDMDAYAFTSAQFAIALFAGAAGFVIFRTNVLLRWLGLIGIAAAILLVIGAAWPIDGDDEGTLATFGFIGFPLTALFVISTSIAMILKKEPPVPLP